MKITFPNFFEASLPYEMEILGSIFPENFDEICGKLGSWKGHKWLNSFYLNFLLLDDECKNKSQVTPWKDLTLDEQGVIECISKHHFNLKYYYTLSMILPTLRQNVFKKEGNFRF